MPVCRKERSMDNKLKFQQLECYKLATDEQKEKLNKEQYFDLAEDPHELKDLISDSSRTPVSASCSVRGIGPLLPRCTSSIARLMPS